MSWWLVDGEWTGDAQYVLRLFYHVIRDGSTITDLLSSLLLSAAYVFCSLLCFADKIRTVYTCTDIC